VERGQTDPAESTLSSGVTWNRKETRETDEKGIESGPVCCEGRLGDSDGDGVGQVRANMWHLALHASSFA